MTNFKLETLQKIKEIGKTIEDIDWVECRNFIIDNFWDASDIEYDSSYGSQEMPDDLIIVFKDGSFLERHDYDGSEWWEYKSTPKKPKEIRKIKKITKNRMWDSLNEFLEEK